MSAILWSAAGAYATVAAISWLALRNLAGPDASRLRVAAAAIAWPVMIVALVVGG